MRDEPPGTAHLSPHAGGAARDERCAVCGGSSLIARVGSAYGEGGEAVEDIGETGGQR